MKFRRWRRYGLLAILVVLAAVATWLMARPRLHINQAMFDARFRIGMTLEEIEHLVKVPPGDYSFGFNKANSSSMRARGDAELSVFGSTIDQVVQSLIDNGNAVVWKGPNRQLVVRFDGNGQANLIAFSHYTPPAKDWIGRFVQWLNSSSDE
jgi:hypothetical protein